MSTVLKYSFLAGIAGLSVWSAWPYGSNLNDEGNEWLFLLPGAFFSFFIVIIYHRLFSFYRAALCLILLMIGYIVCFYLSMFTWGLALPVSGALGAFWVNGLVKGEGKWLDRVALMNLFAGFFTGLAGLLMLYALKDVIQLNVSFAITIGAWQLLIGILHLKPATAQRIRRSPAPGQ